MSDTHKSLATLPGQQCPMCGKKTLTLSEAMDEVPFLGRIFIFGMNCASCKFRKSDIECDKQQEPSKWTFEVSSVKDMSVRVVRSAEGTLIIKGIGSLSPGAESEGFISNIEGVLERFKGVIEQAQRDSDDIEEKAKADKLLKTIESVREGKEKVMITLEDPSGNSAIVSEKAVRSALRKRKA